MDALIIYPENQEQLTAIKAVMKAMKVSFEQKKEPYPSHVIDGVKRAIKQADEGNLIPYKGIADMIGSV